MNNSLLDTDLPPGSLVVERYVYKTKNDKPGVQWLAEVVSKKGELLLMRACDTRREALQVLVDTPRWHE